LILTAPASHAQVVRGGALDATIGGTTIEETIEDIEENTQEQFERSQDQARFGSAGVPQGFRGSVAASGTLDTGGDEDSLDVNLGARFTLGQDRLSHTFSLASIYGDDGNDGGDGGGDDGDENQIFAIYDLNYDITDRFYAFGIGRAVYDEFDEVEQDYFIGFGPGYRIFNEPNLAWRVQAGPGVRYQNFAEPGEDSESELAGILSSRFFYGVSNNIFLTNDTDLLYSDASTSVTNDFGANLSLQGPLSLRFGLLTDWDSEDDDEFDHTVTAAVVYSFAP